MSQIGLWNSLIEADTYNQEVLAIKALRMEAVNLVGERCGQCEHWMKSRICPREHNVNGMSRGPNCEAFGCEKFELTAHCQELSDQRSEEADQRTAALVIKRPSDGSTE